MSVPIWASQGLWQGKGQVTGQDSALGTQDGGEGDRGQQEGSPALHLLGQVVDEAEAVALLLLLLPQHPLCQQEICGRDVVVAVGFQRPVWDQGSCMSTQGTYLEGPPEAFEGAPTLASHHSLLDGVPIRDVPAHHGLEDDLVLLLRHALVGGEGQQGAAGRGRVHPLQPRVALDLLQGCSLLRVPLQHPGDETGGKE